MTNSENLLAQIKPACHPDDLIMRALDAHQEDHGAGLLAAVLAVASAYHAAQRSEELSLACAALDPASEQSEWLRGRIYRESPVQPAIRARVDLVNGSTPPEFCYDTYSVDEGQWSEPTVTVGAGWILAVLATEYPGDRPSKPKYRRAPR